MSAAQTVVSFRKDTGQLAVLLVTDPPALMEIPAMRRPRIAVHSGRSVFMECRRAGMTHRGLAVHGDIHIIPAGTPCIWEPKQPDTALIVTIGPGLLLQAAEDLELHADGMEVVNRFQIRDAQIEHLCWALKAEMEAAYPTGRLFLDGLATSLAAAMVSRHTSLVGAISGVRLSMRGQRLRKVLSYIEDNLEQNMALGEIAQFVGASVSHLKTTFRQATGMPVHQYVIQR